MLKQNKIFLVISLFLIIIFATFIFISKSDKDSKQEIKAKLITSVHKDLPFEFETENQYVSIKPGEVKTINYTIKNLSKKSMSGMATFQVYPTELKDYMTKMNVFVMKTDFKRATKEKYALVLLVNFNEREYKRGYNSICFF